MVAINDRVKETTTTTGQGTVDLGGAKTGFETLYSYIGLIKLYRPYIAV